MTDTLVCELARKGKLLVGDPFFEGGVPVTVDRKGAGEAAVGDLVVLRLGRGRARIEEVLGPASRIEAVLEGLLWHEGVRAGARAAAAVPPETSLTGSTSAISSRSRSTPRERRTSTTR